jgi:hypothetical protein
MSFTLHNREGSFEITLIGAEQNPVVSNPESGEYKIKELRLDADKKIVVVYDTDPEP